MAIGIDPTIDFAFKRLLGSPEHARVTVHFLNAVLHESPRITEVTILNSYLAKEFEDDKLSILDVRATDELGRQLNVEMQTSLPAGIHQRLAYYASCLYVEQLTEGDNYPALRPAISICVMDAVMFPDVADVHLDFRLRDGRHGRVLTNDLQVHTIELPKYECPAHNERISDPLDEWVYFFRFAASSTAEEIAARLVDAEFCEATGVLEMIAKTPTERAAYEARLKFQRDAEARLMYAEQAGHEAGRERGHAEGHAEGHADGEARGEQVGRIRLLQQLLGADELPLDELAQMDLAALEKMAKDLQAQLDSRK